MRNNTASKKNHPASFVLVRTTCTFVVAPQFSTPRLIKGDRAREGSRK